MVRRVEDLPARALLDAAGAGAHVAQREGGEDGDPPARPGDHELARVVQVDGLRGRGGRRPGGDAVEESHGGIDVGGEGRRQGRSGAAGRGRRAGRSDPRRGSCRAGRRRRRARSGGGPGRAGSPPRSGFRRRRRSGRRRRGRGQRVAPEQLPQPGRRRIDRPAGPQRLAAGVAAVGRPLGGDVEPGPQVVEGGGLAVEPPEERRRGIGDEQVEGVVARRLGARAELPGRGRRRLARARGSRSPRGSSGWDREGGRGTSGSW